MKKLIAATLTVALLAGCSSGRDQVVRYDQNGVLIAAKEATLAPETQDNVNTTLGVLAAAAAIAGTVLGIIAVSK